MFSSRVWQAAALAGLFALISACGHKGPPKPPPQKIPAPILDLVVTQRGNEILAHFTYPTTTIAGLPVEDVIQIELWEYTLQVPEFSSSALGVDDDSAEGDEEEGAPVEDGDEGDETDPADADAETEPAEMLEELPVEDDAEVEDEESAADEGEDPASVDEESAADDDEDLASDDEESASDEAEDDEGDDEEEPSIPAPSKETLLEFDPLEFVAGARLTSRLQGVELAQAISGDRVYMRVPLDSIEPGEKEAKVYGVKSFEKLERSSAFSNLYKIIPRETPEPPVELEADPTPGGVRISWTFEGEDPAEFRFYRRDALAPTYRNHLGTQDGDERRFLDSGAAFGATYKYVMTAVVNRDPLVESTFSEELEWEYLDDFPPAPPTELVILPEMGLARLLWDASDDDDVVGYVIHRRLLGGKYEPLNETPSPGSTYSDRTAASGRTYAYRVVAVDTQGNESDPSEEVEVRIP